MPERLHSIHLTTEYPPDVEGGLGTHIGILAEALAAADQPVTVLAMTTRQELPEDLRRGALHVRWFRPPSFQWALYGELAVNPDAGEARAFEAALLEEVLRFAEQAIPTHDGLQRVLHIHDSHLVRPAVRLAQALSIPLVWASHDSAEAPVLWGGEVAPHLRALEREAALAAHAIIVTSPWMRDFLRERHGVEAWLVPYGVDAARFQQPTRSPDALRELRARFAAPDDPLILFCGRFVPQKGMDALIASAELVARELPSVRYLFAGSLHARPFDPGSPRTGTWVEELLARHPLAQERVRFTGFVPRNELVDYYALATLAVVPSYHEAFGFAAAEPMAAGTPVVATATGGLLALIEEGRTGVSVPVHAPDSGRPRVEPRELAAAQLRILRDSALAHRLAQSAREHIASFTIDQMISKTLEVYRRAVTR